MKLNTRQPICLTKLKRKSTFLRQHECEEKEKFTLVLNQINNSHQLVKKVAPKIRLIQSVKKTSESELNQYRQLVHSLEEKIDQKNRESVEKQNIIERLEHDKQQLKEQNLSMRVKVYNQQQERFIICNRVEHMEQDLSQLQEGYKAETSIKFQVTNAIKVNKPNNDSKYDHNIRRLSLYEGEMKQDLGTKLKQSKNQLELQKIRRMNLERQLKNCYQNNQIEMKLHLQVMQKKIQTIKQQLQRKCQEVKQKQLLINRYVINK